MFGVKNMTMTTSSGNMDSLNKRHPILDILILGGLMKNIGNMDSLNKRHPIINVSISGGL